MKKLSREVTRLLPAESQRAFSQSNPGDFFQAECVYNGCLEDRLLNDEPVGVNTDVLFSIAIRSLAFSSTIAEQIIL
jgi:hypothetical protein